MKRALLITMPFATTMRPSIGLGLLKAALTRDGLACDVLYLNLRFAEQIGAMTYEQIAGGIPRLLFGESIFARDLFGDRIPPVERYFAEVLSRLQDGSFGYENHEISIPDVSCELLRLRSAAARFLDDCVTTIQWDHYALVGFSTNFQQNLASLALARRVKEHCPHITIVLGGANCEGEMGIALHRLFPFVDYVCSGEADLTFPSLAESILAGEPPQDLPGVIRRIDGQTVRPRVASAPVSNMDSLPFPDYDDFVEQHAVVNLELEPQTRLFIETSRGCWWGEKAHCTFCGLNGSTMQFRAKSPGRVVTELTTLVNRYQTRSFAAVDNILDMRYFRDVLPRLIELDLDLDLFYETKANLRKEQVRLLREAGILQIQSGIESLNSNVLRLMRKGASALQNIQLLRWSSEFMVQPFWNLLAGFPGEDPDDYARQAEIVPLLTHLTPPSGVSLVRLDRFSPLFFDGDRLGVRNIRATVAYGYVYPFPPDDLSDLAYYFDFDYADGREPPKYVRDLRQQVSVWSEAAPRAQLTSLADGDTLVICDTRPVAVQHEYGLRGLARSVYEHCDTAHTRAELEGHFRRVTTESSVEAEIERILNELLQAKLILHEDGRYLSLGVDATYQMESVAPRYAQRQELSGPMRYALTRFLDSRTPTLTALFAARLAATISIPASFTLSRQKPEAAVGAP